MSVSFKNILEVDKSIQRKVLTWRNSDYIKRFMYCDHDISNDEHFLWIDSLKKSQTDIVFVVYYHDSPIGIVSVNKISKLHLTCDWAFYLAPDAAKGQGVGAVIEVKILNYIFDELNIVKVNCEVLSFNESVVKMHERFGFKIEGVRRANILKGGERHDVVLLGLCQDEWEPNRFNSLMKRYT